MDLKRLLPILALGVAGCATNYVPPQTPPPPLWDGESGWQADAHSIRVNEGVRQIGEVIVEHDAQLVRTGLITEALQLKNAFGAEIVIPAGTKAFATDYVLTTGPQRARQTINPIEWCAYLPQGIDGKKPGPQSVCFFWESEQRASYNESSVGEFAFLPAFSPAGMHGSVPKIEEAPVDFGIRFKRLLRVGAITNETITLEFTYSDGAAASRPERDVYNWKPDGTLIHSFGSEAIVLTRSADLKTVDVRLQIPEPQQIGPNVTEYTVLLELLVGTHGLVKEARVLRSSGNAEADAIALKKAEYEMKLEPFIENGRRVEKRGRFPVTVAVHK